MCIKPLGNMATRAFRKILKSDITPLKFEPCKKSLNIDEFVKTNNEPMKELPEAFVRKLKEKFPELYK